MTVVTISLPVSFDPSLTGLAASVQAFVVDAAGTTHGPFAGAVEGPGANASYLVPVPVNASWVPGNYYGVVTSPPAGFVGSAYTDYGLLTAAMLSASVTAPAVGVPPPSGQSSAGAATQTLPFSAPLPAGLALDTNSQVGVTLSGPPAPGGGTLTLAFEQADPGAPAITDSGGTSGVVSGTYTLPVFLGAGSGTLTIVLPTVAVATGLPGPPLSVGPLAFTVGGGYSESVGGGSASPPTDGLDLCPAFGPPTFGLTSDSFPSISWESAGYLHVPLLSLVSGVDDSDQTPNLSSYAVKVGLTQTGMASDAAFAPAYWESYTSGGQVSRYCGCACGEYAAGGVSPFPSAPGDYFVVVQVGGVVWGPVGVVTFTG